MFVLNSKLTEQPQYLSGKRKSPGRPVRRCGTRPAVVQD
jgi:hypothetical protein